VTDIATQRVVWDARAMAMRALHERMLMAVETDWSATVDRIIDRAKKAAAAVAAMEAELEAPAPKEAE
jgi:hypothetical protein